MPQNISRQTSKSLTGTRKGTHLVFFQGRLAPSSWVSPKHYDGSHLLSFCPIAKWPSSHGSQAWILFVVATLPPFEPKNKLQFWVAFLMFPLIRSTSRHIHLPFYSASQDSKYTTSHQTHYGLGRFPLNLWCYGLLVTFGKALVFFPDLTTTPSALRKRKEVWIFVLGWPQLSPGPVEWFHTHDFPQSQLSSKSLPCSKIRCHMAGPV